ncbi:MAG TPA: GerMN domain-containing protein [Ktedonobacterales bacterium]
MARPHSSGPRLSRLILHASVSGALGLICLLSAACTSTSTIHGSPTATSTSAALATATTSPASTSGSGIGVLVYFSKHPESDSNPSAVFPVNRTAPDLKVATYAMTQLIAGPSASESAAGYYTPISTIFSGASNCGGADFTITLNMKGSTPAQGTATLQFCRATQLPGDLTGSYITAEINKTLTQFPTIQHVVILTQNGSCFDDMRGGNLCLS